MKTVPKFGQFKGIGGAVPIYGVESMNLKKESNWKVLGTGIMSTTMAEWQGDNPVTWEFDFMLAAGVGEIKDRKKLYDSMKVMHSWACHQGDEKPAHPPIVQLIVPGFISCKGTFTVVQTSAKPPWEVKGGSVYPTFCQFTGSFLLLPGMEDAGVKIVKNVKKFSASSVSGSFYSG